MSELKVFDDLESLLTLQIELFEKVAQLQNLILETLNSGANFAKVMELLTQKETVVAEISKNSEEHKPFIADWMQRKHEFADHPQFPKIETLLSKIESCVQDIHEQDDKMMKFFQSTPKSQADQDPQNLINAYRGLR